MTPALGEDARTQYTYTSATGTTGAKVLIEGLPNGGSTTALAASEIEFDGFGRVAFERRKIPGPAGTPIWNVRQTLYNGRGDRESVSELGSPSPGGLTEFKLYDPFGRPGKIVPPDDIDHKVDLVYTGVSSTSRTVQVGGEGGVEFPATTTEEFDRQGRLWRVTEPSGEAGAMVTTTYGYDVGNRLASVSTTAMVDGANVTQERTFTYDLLGFLREEEHPEKDDPVEYSNYDARGHARRKVDGPSDLTFTYDRAERLQKVDVTATSRTSPTRAASWQLVQDPASRHGP